MNCFWCGKSCSDSKTTYIAFNDVTGHVSCWLNFKKAIMSLVAREIDGEYDPKLIARSLSIGEDWNVY